MINEEININRGICKTCIFPVKNNYSNQKISSLLKKEEN